MPGASIASPGLSRALFEVYLGSSSVVPEARAAWVAGERWHSWQLAAPHGVAGGWVGRLAFRSSSSFGQAAPSPRPAQPGWQGAQARLGGSLSCRLLRVLGRRGARFDSCLGSASVAPEARSARVGVQGSALWTLKAWLPRPRPLMALAQGLAAPSRRPCPLPSWRPCFAPLPDQAPSGC